MKQKDLKAGMFVRVKKNANRSKAMRSGPGWLGVMDATLGQVGRVVREAQTPTAVILQFNDIDLINYAYTPDVLTVMPTTAVVRHILRKHKVMPRYTNKYEKCHTVKCYGEPSSEVIAAIEADFNAYGLQGITTKLFISQNPYGLWTSFIVRVPAQPHELAFME